MSNRKIQLWRVNTLALGLLLTMEVDAMAQLTIPGGKGVPTGNVTGSLPGLGGSVPQVPNPARPTVGGNLNSVTGQIGGLTNQASNSVGNTTRAAGQIGNSTGRTVDSVGKTVDRSSTSVGAAAAATTGPANAVSRYQAPAVGSKLHGTNLPLVISGQTIQGLGANGNVGFSVDTTGKSLKIQEVKAGTLAAKAGFKSGDEILAVDRQWVKSVAQFQADLATALSSTGHAWVMVDRKGKQDWVSLDADGETRSALGTAYKVDDDGVTVTKVFDGFAGADAGLKTGDQIVSINGTSVQSRNDFLAATTANAGSDVAVLINRSGVQKTLNVTLPASQHLSANISATDSQKATSQVSQLNQHVSGLSETLGRLTDSGIAGVTERVSSLNDSIASLQKTTSAAAESGKGLTADQIRFVISEASKVRASLESLGLQASGQASTDVNAALANTIAVQSEITSMAKVNDAAIGPVTQQAVVSVQQVSQKLMTSINEIPEDATATVNTQISAAMNDAQGLHNSAAALAVDQLDNAAMVRENAAMIQARMMIAARQAAPPVRARISSVFGEAATVRDYATLLTTNTVEGIQPNTSATIARVSQQLKAASDTIGRTSDQTSATAAATLRSTQDQLAALQESFAPALNGTVEDATITAVSAMNELDEIEGELVDAAILAPADVQTEIARSIAAVDLASEDLRLYASSTVNLSGQISSSNDVRLRTDSVAGTR
ncbi:MAG: PDZ domain-containing protein [Planctomycetaceae bacterium]